VNHIPEDLLEGYAMLTLPRRRIAPLEDHLMICPECQDRLQSVTDFVIAVRGAAQKITQAQHPVKEKTFRAGSDSSC
jgi:hypothetical protein